MEVRVLLLATLLCATPLMAQEAPAPRADAAPGPATFLLARTVELSLTPRQVAVLQRLEERSAAENGELRSLIAAERRAVYEEERRSEAAGPGSGSAPQPRRGSARPQRIAARDAARQLRANIQEEANAARAVLTEEQWKRLRRDPQLCLGDTLDERVAPLGSAACGFRSGRGKVLSRRASRESDRLPHYAQSLASADSRQSALGCSWHSPCRKIRMRGFPRATLFEVCREPARARELASSQTR